MSVGVAESLRLMFANALLVRQEDGVEVDLQAGRTVTKAPRYMRTQLWLGVLQRYPGLGNKAARQYHVLVRKPVPEVIADDIAKDVGRTFPNILRFKTAAGQMSLLRVLRAYAVYDPEVNYCQGMNFLAALLLIWMPSEADAFGGLVVLMEERGLRELYKKKMSTLQARLWQIGQLLPKQLADHLEANSVLPVLYASSWLLTAFSADFPLFWSSRIMDVILTDCYIEPMMKVVLGLMRTCQPSLMRSNDMERMVRFIKVGPPRWPHATLQEVLTDSLSMEWTGEQAAVLRQTEGIETVVQAVARVHDANQVRDAGEQRVSSGESAADEQQEAAGARDSAPQRNTSLSWASRFASPVPLSPLPLAPAPRTHGLTSERPQESGAHDLRNELSPRSDCLDIAAHPSKPGSSHLLDSPPASIFAPEAAKPHASEGDLHRSTELSCMTEASLAQRSSNGSFGDFTGSADALGSLSQPSFDPSASSGLGEVPEGAFREASVPIPEQDLKDWNRDFWEEENCERKPSSQGNTNGLQEAERPGSASHKHLQGPSHTQSHFSETSFGSFQGDRSKASGAEGRSSPPAPARSDLPKPQELQQHISGGGRSLLDEDVGCIDLPVFDSLSLNVHSPGAPTLSNARLSGTEQPGRRSSRLEEELSNFTLR